jgi:hypothetical protein
MASLRNHLFHTAYRLNSAVSTGKYGNVSVRTIKQKVESAAILDYLENELGIDLDIGLSPSAADRTTLVQTWQQVENNRHPSEVHIEPDGNGLCLLIAYTLEAIQEGVTPDGY